MLKADINCDMGESSALWNYSIEKDIALLEYISSMNLACGFHAGDAGTMEKLITAALDKKVAIGAHPSFPDREHFGRTNMTMPGEELYAVVTYQLGALRALLQVKGARMHHVKPHGALYNMAAGDRGMADIVCKAIHDADPSLVLYGLSGSALIAAAHGAGLQSCSEVFADRTYQDNGSLTPRTQPNALIAHEPDALQQVLQMVQQQTVRSVSGREIPIAAETICIHGDGPHALAFAKNIYMALKQKGIEIRTV